MLLGAVASALAVEEVVKQEKKEQWERKLPARRAQRWRGESSSKAT
jgi:hypothetical protein